LTLIDQFTSVRGWCRGAISESQAASGRLSTKAANCELARS
jgi:hypothetical protein